MYIQCMDRTKHSQTKVLIYTWQIYTVSIHKDVHNEVTPVINHRNVIFKVYSFGLYNTQSVKKCTVFNIIIYRIVFNNSLWMQG